MSLEKTTFERVVADAPADAVEARTASFEAFLAASMPTGREEAWRYVEPDFNLADMTMADSPGTALESPFLADLVERAGTVTMIDGFVTNIDLKGAAGLHVDRSDAAGPPPVTDADIFAMAAGAFWRDGVTISTDVNAVVTDPIVVEVHATQGAAVSFPVVRLAVGENSELPVVVVFVSGPEQMVVSPQISADIGDGARLRLTTLQAWGEATRAVGFSRLALGRDSSIKVGEVGLGGRLARLDLQVDLDGDGSSSDLTGIYFGDGEQVLDYRIVVNHRGKNTSSDVFLKGAVEDQSESVFTGLLKIWPDATNTSTFETNRNLVLSEDAKAHSVPNLEILCDDVVCGHGSTVGPLEADHLYYLQSRGLNKDRAERLLLRGFFEEMIARLPAPQLAPSVRTAVNEKFESAQLEGRLA